ncbi:DUF3445 domain-containing protein [Mesobacterium sp. TK19101]|uniref:DUF3445 domain-containing protein n=1 Tax=Mesobacterium hydrothermale TaxID=3111907 RepID=A0ABU6HF25_9RHOB|nr:DUF3445 domain-containing protein [Mesobacterium sp. TK19101]MEC3860063.1 DUF3445 domain-containing protein [Mesobacterium sp. TK19101]
MILQSVLPYDVLTPRPLPGIAPTAMAEWLMVDDAYAAQMAHRAALLRDRRDAVFVQDPSAGTAAAELLETVLDWLPTGFSRQGDRVTRPDGVSVVVDWNAPLWTLAHLVQEDLCILQKPDGSDEHVLTAAALCFPASWRLAEKFMRPLTTIHVPVKDYDSDLARRVQRLFDAIRPGRPLWRFNALWYDDPELYQPRSAVESRKLTDKDKAPYFRSERQCLVRLPRSGAVVFSIHTFVLRADAIRAPAGPAAG